MFAYYARWWGDFEMNPRSAPSKGVSLVKHRQWFYDKDLPHLSMVESRHHTLNLVRFIVGSTDLRVYEHTRPRTPRSERICLLCGSGRVEDELHVLLECRLYDPLRSNEYWSPLFQIEYIDMKKFMNQKDQSRVAQFITAVFRVRKEALLSRNARGGVHYTDTDLFSSTDSEYECDEVRGSHPVSRQL